MLELFAKNSKFSKFGFARSHQRLKKGVFFEKISFKKKKDLLIKDKKDAGALKVKKKIFKKLYLYADLLLRSGYIKLLRKLLKIKSIPCCDAHVK